MPLAIVPALPSDADTLSALARATFPLACPAAMPAADLQAFLDLELSPRRFLAQLGDRRRSVWLACQTGRAIGYLMLTREAPPVALRCRHPLLLQRLYVLPEFHGAGVAQALVDHAIALAVAEHDALWLTVGNFNQRAIAFYRRQGFHAAGETLFMVGADAQTDWVMLRPIAQRADSDSSRSQ